MGVRKNVKGSLFVDYVRMIRRRKEVDWRQHLQPEDLIFLGQPIVDSEWYPMETFERMGLAILHEFARGEMNAVRLWGRQSIDHLLSHYQSLICEGDPRESLMRSQVLRRSFFDFPALDLQVLFGTYAKIQISYGMSPLAEQAASYQALGFFERLLELSGASKIEHQFPRQAWAGAPATILELNWREDLYTRRVKGILFLDYVKMIKARKDVDWSRYLLPEDLLFLKQPIVDLEWYPMETSERMGIGILQEIAQGNLDAVRLWGWHSIDGLSRMYPDLICERDPRESLMRFMVLRRGFFDYGVFNLLFLSGDYAKLEINYEMGKTAEEAASSQTLGFFQRLLELSGALNIRHRFTSRVWKGDPATILELNWEEGNLPAEKSSG